MPQLIDPKVADLAPSGPDLTLYDEEHGITTCAYSTPLRKAPTGARWCRSC